MLPSPFGRSEPMPASSVSSAATPRPLISGSSSGTSASASPGPDSNSPGSGKPGSGQHSPRTSPPASEPSGDASDGDSGKGEGSRHGTPSAGNGRGPGAGNQGRRRRPEAATSRAPGCCTSWPRPAVTTARAGVAPSADGLWSRRPAARRTSRSSADGCWATAAPAATGSRSRPRLRSPPPPLPRLPRRRPPVARPLALADAGPSGFALTERRERRNGERLTGSSGTADGLAGTGSAAVTDRLRRRIRPA